MIKIISIIGARPQFIKVAAMEHACRNNGSVDHVIVHTGQHYDDEMSGEFFRSLQIGKPAYNFNINNLSHGAMTGRMMEKAEEVLLVEKPDVVFVYGDTNSTLAGALAAKKIKLPVAHIEAGLRNFDMQMPEEINRVLTDRISNLLFCPTETAVENLNKEGFAQFDCEVHLTGDIMYDAVRLFGGENSAAKKMKKPFILCTLHREEAVKSEPLLKEVVNAIAALHRHIAVVFPAHPGTRKAIEKIDPSVSFLLPPFTYAEMCEAYRNCACVITDSGGVQKEAYFFKKPCITLRDNTEWKELTEAGVNVLAGHENFDLLNLFNKMTQGKLDFSRNFFGSGESARIILEATIGFIKKKSG